MPGHKQHKKFGFIIAGGSILLAMVFLHLQDYSFTLFEVLMGIFFVSVYAVLPDLDSPSSRIRNIGLKLLFWALFLMSIIATGYYYAWIGFLSERTVDIIFLLLPLLSLIGLIIMYLAHRKWMHTLSAAFILSFPLAFISLILFPVSFLVYSSHVLLDRSYGKKKRK